MDPKGKGKVTDKEKEILFGDKEGETVYYGSDKTKKDGKKKKCVKKIVYYDSNVSSSSPKEKDDDSSFKKKTFKQNYSFDYSHILYNSYAHFLSIPLGKPLTLMGKIILFGVIKCVVVYFLFIRAFGKQ
jgi:hypothetical protein